MVLNETIKNHLYYLIIMHKQNRLKTSKPIKYYRTYIILYVFIVLYPKIIKNNIYITILHIDIKYLSINNSILDKLKSYYISPNLIPSRSMGIRKEDLILFSLSGIGRPDVTGTAFTKCQVAFVFNINMNTLDL